MEKPKKVFDESWRKKVLAKLPPKERERVEQNIIRSEKLAAKWRREEEALMRMPKEGRLKRICKEHLITAFEYGKITEDALNTPEHKETAEYLERRFRRQCGSGLTWTLKKANVLPLGK